MILTTDENGNTKSVPEVLTEVMEAIISQEGKCMREGDCIYGDDGRHCAVGWLLPFDQEELMGFVGSIHTLIEECLDLGPNEVWMIDNVDILGDLQGFHDHGDNYGPLEDYISKELLDKWIEVAKL